MMNKTLFMQRDDHAANYDSDEGCGNVEEHEKLFHAKPNARPGGEVNADNRPN